jgi:hypothetical protein
MRTHLLLAAAILLGTTLARGDGTSGLNPYETAAWSVPQTELDRVVLAKLSEQGIEPANPCSDAVFFRRVYVDVIGTIPDAKDVYAFLQDKRPDKRAALIDSLLARDEFADYWTLKWCDLLRVKSEFPINLWPNAVQAYSHWIHDAIATNMPYDQFVQALLTSSGSNFRVAPVNFYRAIQGRKPDDIAKAVALTFMGTRLDSWPDKQRADLGAFFSRIAFKGTSEWKEEVVCLDPAPAAAFTATLPNGTTVKIGPDDDPRQVFANWLITPGNPWFSKAIANRVWSWLMGRGIIQEPDDIRPDNPAANPQLLAYLQKQLMDSNWDLRALFRLILNSRTYQQSALPRSDKPAALSLSAYYPVRRLDAEVLRDALSWLGGTGEGYSSAVPEPYTWVPDYNRAITLYDGSITSQFLETFGRPSRDTGLESERTSEPTDAQRLYLVSSSEVQRALDRSPRLKALVDGAGKDRSRLVEWIYLTVLSRYPTVVEETAATKYFQSGKVWTTQGTTDLAWALINTKEFLYRH